MNENNLKYVLGIFVATFIWGFGVIATKIAINANYSTYFIMTYRFVIATIIMGIIIRKKIKKIAKQELIYGSVAGLCLFFAFAFQTIGMKTAVPSISAFVTSTCVIMIPLFSFVFLKVQIKKKVAIAAFLSFVGLCILSISNSGKMEISVGAIWTFAGAAIFAWHTIVLGIFSKKMSPAVLTFIQLLVASLLSLAFYLGSGEVNQLVNYDINFLSIIYLAVFSSTIAYFLQITCQRYVGPSTTGIIISMESVFGSALSVLFGFENFSYRLLIGGLIVFLSVIIVETNIFEKSTPNKVKNS